MQPNSITNQPVLSTHRRTRHTYLPNHLRSNPSMEPHHGHRDLSF